MPSKENTETIRFVAAIVSTICLVVLVPIAGWSLKTQIVFQQDAHSRISVLEAWVGDRPQYTRSDAEKDMGRVVEKVNDHELRIRVLERNTK